MSSETKFTKGEWSPFNDYLDDGDIGIMVKLDEDLHQTITVIEPPCDEEDAANAHLISAAPDMYEALDNLLSRMESDKDCKHWFIDEQAASILALRKARGEV